MELLELGAATVAESGGRPLAPRIRPMWPGAALEGPAFTVRCAAADNLAVHAAVAEAPPGSVLVVQVDGAPELGWWGEVLTTGALARGIAGLVIDACVRDTAALAALRFPVFATGIALPGAAKVRGGSVGATVEVGGASVSVGDRVVADADGVALVAAGDVEAVHDAAIARHEREQGFFEALRSGATTIDLLGLDTTSVERAG